MRLNCNVSYCSFSLGWCLGLDFKFNLPFSVLSILTFHNEYVKDKKLLSFNNVFFIFLFNNNGKTKHKFEMCD